MLIPGYGGRWHACLRVDCSRMPIKRWLRTGLAVLFVLCGIGAFLIVNAASKGG